MGAPELITSTSTDDDTMLSSLSLSAPTIRIIASDSYIDPIASEQLSTTASRLKGIIAAVGMPDLHPGGSAGFPIGATIVSHENMIYPPLIGGDIGCGMGLYRTNIRTSASGKEGESASRKLAARIRGIEGEYSPANAGDESTGGSAGVKNWLESAGVSEESLLTPLFEENIDSLGTIGGGNHFAELQAIHEVRDPATYNQYLSSSLSVSHPSSESRPLEPDTSYLFLLVHSGSRGVGQRILASTRSETQKGTLPLYFGTPEFSEYMALHDDACRWARCNRDLIAHRILSCVDSSYVGECSELSRPGKRRESLENSKGDEEKRHVSEVVKERKLLDIWHNVGHSPFMFLFLSTGYREHSRIPMILLECRETILGPDPT